VTSEATTAFVNGMIVDFLEDAEDEEGAGAGGEDTMTEDMTAETIGTVIEVVADTRMTMAGAADVEDVAVGMAADMAETDMITGVVVDTALRPDHPQGDMAMGQVIQLAATDNLLLLLLPHL
jgi:hypothetical protein